MLLPLLWPLLLQLTVLPFSVAAKIYEYLLLVVLLLGF